MTEEKTEPKDESFAAAICELAESAAMVVDEIVESLKPSEEECRRLKRGFWEFQSKLATGLSAIAERRLHDLKTDATPRHADRIVVEDE